MKQVDGHVVVVDKVGRRRGSREVLYVCIGVAKMELRKGRARARVCVCVRFKRLVSRGLLG